MKATVSSNNNLQSRSLATIIDSINECLFYGKAVPKKDLEQVFELIEARQIITGDHLGQISLTPSDIEDGKQLFTGEKLQTQLAIKNILGQEALKFFGLFEPLFLKNTKILELANNWVADSCFTEFCSVGECKHSSICYMRYLNATKPAKYQETLVLFIDLLKQHRNRMNSWDGFPFYYTLLTLLEIDLPEAREELLFALPACERRMNRIVNVNKFTQRRLDILHKVFSRCKYSMKQFLTASS